MSATAFITVEEALAYSNPQFDPPSAEESAVYQVIVDAICQAMENYIHRPIAARPDVKRHDGGSQLIFLPHIKPGVLTVESITEKGKSLTEGTDYTVYPDEGYVVRRSGDSLIEWARGIQAIVIHFTSGVAADSASVPADLKLAAYFAFKLFRRMGDEDFGKRAEAGNYIVPDKFPRASLFIMDRYKLPGGGG